MRLDDDVADRVFIYVLLKVSMDSRASSFHRNSE